MGIGDILAEIIQSVTDLLPRIGHRPARNEWLVVDRWLRGPKTTLDPVAFIPVLTHLEYYPKVRHPLDPGVQTITTADGQTVVINVAAVVIIDDPLLLREHYDEGSWEAGVSLIIRAALADAYAGHNFSHAIDAGTELVIDEVAGTLADCGVTLDFLCVEDRCCVIPLRHFGGATSETS